LILDDLSSPEDALDDLVSKPPPYPVPTHATSDQGIKRTESEPTTELFTIGYENFTGAMLGHSFRLRCLLRNEPHGDVYAVEDLSASPDRYEAKAYVLRGISEKEYRYRVRNLKRLAMKQTFVCSLDQNGRKFIVNRLDEAAGPVSPDSSRQKADALGAIGRRNTVEFEKAFPKLPTNNSPRKPRHCLFH